MRPLRPASGWPARDVSSELGVPLDASTLETLGKWLDLLAEWNAKMDLTAAKDAKALTWLMLADAMMLSKVIARDAHVIDVGTGAGAPGLALAILRRDLRVVLCEPLGKRAAFLRTVLGSLALAEKVSIDPKRGADLEKARFDVAVSRATLPPPEWLELGASLVRPGGDVWLMLAQDAPPTHARCTLTETLAYEDGATGAKKKLIRYVVTL